MKNLELRMTTRAQHLRRNTTDAAKVFWHRIRNKQLGYKFRRHVQIDGYVVDFICFELRLIIELDGGQHTLERDSARTTHLEKRGYCVIRFWNRDVLGNIDGVLESLTQEASKAPR
ncbi:MAG: DUF559 domain-containing protein [Alphaproteobacteria bacterium]|nr:MAG: DUF559 domain-containing protein [Alphaproteobacteria bacterium]